MTKRPKYGSNKHQAKRPKFGPEQPIVSSNARPIGENEIRVEQCNIHLRPGFTVKAMAYNPAIKRLCVVRKLDTPDRQSEDTDLTLLTIVEFYNAHKSSLIFLEKSIPVADSFEALVWIGSWVIIGGMGGRATFLSPFTSRFGRVQICTTDILAMTLAGENQFVIGSNSSELLFLNKRKTFEEDEKQERVKVPAFTTVQTVKLSSDEHVTALACSRQNSARGPEPGTTLLAVGKVNGLSLFVLEKGRWQKHREVAIPRIHTNATIIWALIFVDDFLFAGDSKGQVSIYNAESGSLLKTLKTHQAPVLTLATDGKEVFAAGTDYRIQVITSVSHKDIRFDWQQCGQRLFHSNDVRALCVLGTNWLVSGGAEHELFVSRRHQFSNTQIKPECSFSITNTNLVLIVIRHLFRLDLWCKSIKDQNQNASKPKLRHLMTITSGKSGLIKHVCTSPDGKFLAFAGAVNGAIRVLRLNSDKICHWMKNPESIENGPESNKMITLHWSSHWPEADDASNKTGGKSVSAMLCTNKNLYIARGEFKLDRMDLHTKQITNLLVYSEENGGHLIKLCVDQEEKCLVALTMDSPLYFDLSNPTISPSRLDLSSIFPAYECIFVDSGQVLFLTTDSKQRILLLNLFTKERTELGKDQLKLPTNEWIAYLDLNLEKKRVVGMSNKGRMRMINVEGENLSVFMDETSTERGEKEEGKLYKSTDTRIEPFWSSASSVVTIKSRQENPPTQNPYRLKFFGKN